MSRYESSTPGQHRENAPIRVACAVVTVSDTRTLADDRSGAAIVDLLEGAVGAERQSEHSVHDRRAEIGTLPVLHEPDGPEDRPGNSERSGVLLYPVLLSKCASPVRRWALPTEP